VKHVLDRFRANRKQDDVSMCRDFGDRVVPSACAYVVSSLLPQSAQRAADVAFPNRSDLHEGLLS
jgi:hypothetical protein